MKSHITLSHEAISLSSPSFKRELAKMVGLDLASEQPGDDDVPVNAGDYEYAVLELQAARAFLQNCNDKTKRALKGIVDQGDTFSVAKLEHYMGVPTGISALKGVWTGLTKRTRTITASPNAMLIQWVEDYEHNDWRGWLDPVTLESFRVALSEL